MRKYIRTHQTQSGARYGNAFIIANHYDHSMAAFKKLLREARKTFPGLSETDAECRTVIRSDSCKGCAVLRFPCDPDIVRAGWTNVEKLLDIVV